MDLSVRFQKKDTHTITHEIQYSIRNTNHKRKTICAQICWWITYFVVPFRWCSTSPFDGKKGSFCLDRIVRTFTILTISTTPTLPPTLASAHVRLRCKIPRRNSFTFSGRTPWRSWTSTSHSSFVCRRRSGISIGIAVLFVVTCRIGSRPTGWSTTYLINDDGVCRARRSPVQEIIINHVSKLGSLCVLPISRKRHARFLRLVYREHITFTQLVLPGKWGWCV
jgi:hypothetical protein